MLTFWYYSLLVVTAMIITILVTKLLMVSVIIIIVIIKIRIIRVTAALIIAITVTDRNKDTLHTSLCNDARFLNRFQRKTNIVLSLTKELSFEVLQPSGYSYKLSLVRSAKCFDV